MSTHNSLDKGGIYIKRRSSYRDIVHELGPKQTCKKQRGLSRKVMLRSGDSSWQRPLLLHSCPAPYIATSPTVKCTSSSIKPLTIIISRIRANTGTINCNSDMYLYCISRD